MRKVMLLSFLILLVFQVIGCGNAQCKDIVFPTDIKVGYDETEGYKTDIGYKNTTSSIYINNESTENIYVAVMAAENDSNQTIGSDYVLVEPGKHLIKNTVNENGHEQCYLIIRSDKEGKKVKIKGTWSPDCSVDAEQKLEAVN